MNFYERYANICTTKEMDPCGQKTADMFGVTKATISTWNKRNTSPKGETVAIMADALEVSADYLLGRTDDSTDYTKIKGKNFTPVKPRAIQLYEQLDVADQARVEAYMDGILAGDKYKNTAQVG
ncbi:MAG: helix-turn-helix domain-containing protein [Lachnospiraceae bacterium]|nr:helix-turn-helix domain-containing protein [Lachnospiraceae bacterium]